MDYFKRLVRKRGSALLVVLGFLAFLMVSGVSFSVLMRVERQATSNYKHAVSARHLLEAGLFRAMDEIDSELRISGANYVKFPDWQGRVKVSPVVTDTTDYEEFRRINQQAVARPLSLEALSFIPPILVNDVRYHSIFASSNALDVAKVKTGAKWRPLSMPIENKVSVQTGIGTNAAGQSVVGRYAYTCINLSDMININGVTALGRNVSNRVSIAHLLQMNKQEDFEEQRTLDGGYYATLQDFYAALEAPSAKSRLFSASVSTKGNSPYFDFLKGGPMIENRAFDLSPNPSDTSRNNPTNHVFVTDGYAKSYAELMPAEVCNIAEIQPFTTAELNMSQSQWNSASPPQMNTDFKTALLRCFTDATERNEADIGGVFNAMLADYLSPDDIPPKRLNVPSNKRTPMIAGIGINSLMRPVILKETIGDPPNQKTIYKVQLVGGDAAGASINDVLARLSTPGAATFDIKLCWPFKHHPLVGGEFSLEVDGWISAGIETCHSRSPELRNGRATFSNISIPGSGTIGGLIPGEDQDSCFLRVSVPIQFNNPSELIVSVAEKEEGATQWKQLDGTLDMGKLLITDVVVRVLVKKGGEVFDCVPMGLLPYWGGDLTREMTTTPYLFFQSDRNFTLTESIPENTPIPFEWMALEVPDPRFNHRPDNWYVPESGMLTAGISDIARTLMGENGRDNGIFMATSGAGVLQSPGELGFIARPNEYRVDFDGDGADFLGRDNIGRDSISNDKDYFFRTVRLYDHGGTDDARKADRVFENFEHFDNTASASRRVRINPLSDLPNVLIGAIDRVPYDYRVAWENMDEDVPASVKLTQNYQSYLSAADWQDFSTNWAAHVMDVVDVGEINQLRWRRRIADVYGKWTINSWDSRRWYSGSGGEMRITFRRDNDVLSDINLSKPLYEADRKMLYSFSMDAFSDRQQLFLYVLQAEAMAPGVGSGTRSLAGGRAVAVVWRDPYPSFYPQSLNSSNIDPASPYVPITLQKPSPWGWQTGGNPGLSGGGRHSGYHEQKILFFKQLDN